MILNHYEYSQIKNSVLPDSWRSQQSLDELLDFLQQNWEQRAVFYEDGKLDSKQQFLAFTGRQGIKTQNYIGTIVFKGEQLNIYPKIFRKDADDQNTDNLSQKHLMNNFVQWLEYCNKIEYPFINISSSLSDTENLKELFINLYINYVKIALDRGLFFKYVEETNNMNCIKGKFEVKDYLLNKISSGQLSKFRCSYSDFEFDNKVNRIIKNTCKGLLNQTTTKNQKIIRKILTKLDEVSNINCKPSDCDNIRLSKMHKNYQIIISMSKMFLLNKMSDYTFDSHESFCFLFPTELLFEGFIGGYLQEVLSPFNANVRLQESKTSLIEDIIFEDRSLGSAFTIRHDVLVELDGKIFILDTKYKETKRYKDIDDIQIKKNLCENIKQVDIYQVCEYARKCNAEDVYLLYPMYRFEAEEHSFPFGISKSNNGGKDIKVHFIRLPFVFEKNNINSLKMNLTSIILNIFKIK